MLTITVGLHQGSSLTPYLFILVMDGPTRQVWMRSHGACYLQTVIDETRKWVRSKLELKSEALESK